MTDLQKLKNVFDDLGIEYEVARLNRDTEDVVLTLEEGAGYWGFVCEFRFTKDGKFIEHSVFE